MQVVSARVFLLFVFWSLHQMKCCELNSTRWRWRRTGAAGRRGQIMTEVQNFSHYAINKFPCFKVAIAGGEGVELRCGSDKRNYVYAMERVVHSIAGWAPCNGHISAVQTAPN